MAYQMWRCVACGSLYGVNPEAVPYPFTCRAPECRENGNVVEPFRHFAAGAIRSPDRGSERPIPFSLLPYSPLHIQRLMARAEGLLVEVGADLLGMELADLHMRVVEVVRALDASAERVADLRARQGGGNG